MSRALSRHRDTILDDAAGSQRPDDLAHPAAKVEDFTFEHKLGQGTFGIVYKGVSKRYNKLVAIKHVLCRIQDKNLSITTMREITVLKLLKHDNIIELLDVISDNKNDYLNSHIHNPQLYRLNNVLCMVFPYMSYDLTGILQNADISLTEPDRKSIMFQLFQGIDFIHQNHYIHRDIKASNILINQNGVLKIGDFGLVRYYRGKVPELDKQGGGDYPLTEVVMTRWYRAPEVLFGNRKYGTAVDIWGIGCVFGELYEKVPILKGESDIDQGLKIFQLCGAPSSSMVNFTRWQTNSSVHPSKIAKNGNLHERFTQSMTTEAVSLLKGLLEVDPRYRFTTAKALEHEWFHTAPLPAERVETKFPECHEADAIRNNQLEKAKVRPQPASPAVTDNSNYKQAKSVPYNSIPATNPSFPSKPKFPNQPVSNYPVSQEAQFSGYPPVNPSTLNYNNPVSAQAHALVPSQTQGSHLPPTSQVQQHQKHQQYANRNSYNSHNNYPPKNQNYYNNNGYDSNQRNQYPTYGQSNQNNIYNSRANNNSFNQRNRPRKLFVPEPDDRSDSISPNARIPTGSSDIPKVSNSSQSRDNTPAKSQFSSTPNSSSNNTNSPIGYPRDVRQNFKESRTFQERHKYSNGQNSSTNRNDNNGSNYYGSYKQRSARASQSETEEEPTQKKAKMDYD